MQFFLGYIGRSVTKGKLKLSISEAADVEPNVIARLCTHCCSMDF